MSETTDSPGRTTLALLTLGFTAFGLLMVLHGLGITSAAWFNPNPHTPQWVFAATGLFLLFGGFLTLGRIVAIPHRFINTVGYGAVGLAMVMAHWLVFFAEGASCGNGGGGWFFVSAGILCRGLAGLALLFVDLLLIAATVATVMQRSRKPF